MISEHASPLAALGGVDAGGQNVVVAALAQHLARRGHDVTVYTRRDDPDLAESVDLADGVRVVHVPAGPPAPLPKDELEPFMDDFGRWTARHWSTVGTPDLVHAHFWMSGIAARRAAAAAGIPVVQTFHALGVVKRRHQGSADTSPPDRLDVERELAAGADLVLATCRDEREELLALGADPARIEIVPCGVDLDAFTPSPPPGEARPPRILSLGRLVERKGVETLVRALAQLTATDGLEDTELVIAGGPDRDDLDGDPEALRLRAVARECGVAERVHLLGRIDHETIGELLADTDVVACAPWYEPFGMVPLEAMAAGRPIVGSAVGGFLDTIEHERTGLHVPPRDASATAAALRRILTDPREAAEMGRAGRERVERLYGWERVAEATERAYRQVLSRYRGRRPSGDRAGRWLERHLDELRTASARASAHATTIDRWGAHLAGVLTAGGRLLAAGNGGSAAEAQHLTAELVGRFVDERVPLSALCLSSETSSLTALLNDYGRDEVFARQVAAHGRSGDVLVLLSTSGRSSNVLAAAERARACGLRVWALTGPGPNPLAGLADEAIAVDAPSGSVVQELHLALVHALCAAVDARLLPVSTSTATTATSPAPTVALAPPTPIPAAASAETGGRA